MYRLKSISTWPFPSPKIGERLYLIEKENPYHHKYYTGHDLFWKSRDGRYFRLTDMSRKHIKKIIYILQEHLYLWKLTDDVFGRTEYVKNDLPAEDWIKIFQSELECRKSLKVKPIIN